MPGARLGIHLTVDHMSQSRLSGAFVVRQQTHDQSHLSLMQGVQLRVAPECVHAATVAEEVLLSPEVVTAVGDACRLQPAADGHALLLGMAEPTPASAATSPTAITPNAPTPSAAGGSKPSPAVRREGKEKAGRELVALPPPLQLRAVQVG